MCLHDRGAERLTALPCAIVRIRQPAVSGSFYEATASRLERQVSACFESAELASSKTEGAIGAVVPHAGLMYSGHVAAQLYGNVRLPRRLLILGPNHTGRGSAAAIERSGAWRTPLGDVRIDEELASAVLAGAPFVEEDTRAHEREHSIEVQLPLLQHVLGEFTFAPVCLAIPTFERCAVLGRALAAAVRRIGEPVAILASSDLNHYENRQITEVKDADAIAPILALDAESLWRTVHDRDISMCGIVPTTTMIVAAKELGASRGELLRHATSGEINGDYGAVVGYASILIS